MSPCYCCSTAIVAAAVVEPQAPPEPAMPSDPGEIAALACSVSEEANALVTGLQHLTGQCALSFYATVHMWVLVQTCRQIRF